MRWLLAAGEARQPVGNLTDQRHAAAITVVDDVHQGRRRWLALGWEGRW